MTRIYRALLLLYPKAYRNEYGAAMAETYARRLAELAGSARRQRVRFALREAVGLVRNALRERFGGARTPGTAARPGPRAVRPGRGVDNGYREVRHAVRRLRRTPGFTAAAVLTLAIGLGGNAAIFAFVHSIVLNPLPYPDADRLVRVAAEIRAIDAQGIEIPIGFWLGYREASRTFDDIGLFEYTSVNLAGEGEPERLEAIAATGSVFATLAVPPLLGRPLQEADESPGAAAVAVISHGVWIRRYGADPTILGRPVELDGVATEVVGVMPPGFDFPRPGTAIWLPLTIDRAREHSLSFSYSAIGRMRAGVTIDRALADLGAANSRLPEMFGNITAEFLDEYGVSPWLQDYKSTVVGDSDTTLWLAAGALGFLLLIATANVANLFLVRTEARRREVGLRAALGASRADLVRYVLAESFVVAALAGAAALAVAHAAVRVLVANAPDGLPRLGEVQVGLAGAAFTVALSLIISLVFAWLPIARLATGGGNDLRRDIGRAGSGARRTADALVVGEVALVLVLLVGAALFARSLSNLTRIDPGFDADGVLTFRLSLPASTYPDARRRALFHQQLVERFESLPGVEAAGVARCLPLEGWCGGDSVSSPDATVPEETFRDVASVKPVSPGYFRALGIAMLRGRGFQRSDHEAARGAAVLSEALADRLFPGVDPIGKRVHPSESGPEQADEWYTVVGVVETVKRLELDEEDADILYLPMVGTPNDPLPSLDEVRVAVRTTGDLAPLAASVRDTVWSLDDDVPVAAVEPMAAVLARASARVAFTAALLGIAATAALLLGAVGIYGVVSQAVGRRTSEIGVRMALGAHRSAVLCMVLRRGLLVGLVGVGSGLAATAALGGFLASQLHGVTPLDPLTLATVSLGLLATALIASYVPARRAASVDPVVALKRE